MPSLWMPMDLPYGSVPLSRSIGSPLMAEMADRVKRDTGRYQLTSTP
ncbi:MAG: hypothetical protein AB1420_16840 [Bacillota bacterium]